MLVGQFHYALRQRCRKQHIQSLFRLRQLAEQVADVLDEAQIEHPVSFVENGDLNLVQFEHALLVIVDDPTRRSDQDIDTRLDRSALLLIAGTPVREGDFQSGMFGQNLGIGADLDGQFARRSKNEDLGLPLLCPLLIPIAASKRAE